MVGVPEQLGGARRRALGDVTAVLIAEALAQGDMGIALACLAPGGRRDRARPVGRRRPAGRPTCPRSSARTLPAAALAVLEPRSRCSTRSRCDTRGPRAGGDYLLNGVKALVPRAADGRAARRRRRARRTRPALFLVESRRRGCQRRARARRWASAPPPPAG